MLELKKGTFASSSSGSSVWPAGRTSPGAPVCAWSPGSPAPSYSWRTSSRYCCSGFHEFLTGSSDCSSPDTLLHRRREAAVKQNLLKSKSGHEPGVETWQRSSDQGYVIIILFPFFFPPSFFWALIFYFYTSNPFFFPLVLLYFLLSLLHFSFLISFTFFLLSKPRILLQTLLSPRLFLISLHLLSSSVNTYRSCFFFFFHSWFSALLHWKHTHKQLSVQKQVGSVWWPVEMKFKLTPNKHFLVFVVKGNGGKEFTLLWHEQRV